MAARAQQKARIPLPPGIDKADRNRIGLDIITFIQEKAINDHKGFNKNTGRYRRFPLYTKEYAKKKRTSVSNVDLVLSADMFNAMKILREGPGFVTVGFDRGKQNDKAEGNQLGTYGQRSPNPRKARPFLGITQAALLGIIKDVATDGSAG